MIRYLKQVGPDGKFVISPSPSPKASPNHMVDTLKVGRAASSPTPMEKEDEGGGGRERDYSALLKQIQRMGMDKSMQGEYLSVTYMYSHIHV